MKSILILFTVIFTTSGCQSDYHEILKPENQADFAPGLGNDGVLIGIEKYQPHEIGKKWGVDIKRFSSGNSKNRYGDAKKFIRLNQEAKSMLITHILDFKVDEKQKGKWVKPARYNGYGSDLDHLPDYEKGYQALNDFKKELKSKLRTHKYSHVIFISMGWHNDQLESVKRYRQIISEIKIQAQNNGDNSFNPYVVSITWPSSWMSQRSGLLELFGWWFSVLNKADDADEVGYTVANVILHNVILDTVGQINQDLDGNKKIKTVGVGHSFGGRLISRAIFSKKYLKNDTSKGNELDLFVGLQPAFSINRFLLHHGVEDHPYIYHQAMRTKFVLTTSDYDSGNRLGFWAPYVGGSYSYGIVDKHSDIFRSHQALVYDGHLRGVKPWNDSNDKKYIEFVKCEFIRNHNDVLDAEMGVFLYEMIKRLENN